MPKATTASRPDLTTLAKILAGGLPGGCVAGRADILAFIEPRPGKPKMKHPGTYNANPLSAAAGIATLKRIATGEPCAKANAAGRLLRNELNELFESRNWPWVAYGDFSMVRVMPNYSRRAAANRRGRQRRPRPARRRRERTGRPEEPEASLRTTAGDATQWRGLVGLAGMTSCAHTDDVISHTVQAFEASVEAMMAEGLV